MYNTHTYIYIYIYICVYYIYIYIYMYTVYTVCIYIWSGTEGGAINGGVPPGSCYFGPWKTTPQWRAFVLLACE